MAFPEPYQHQPDFIASYDFTDIEDGTGVVNYFALSGSQGWFLSAEEDYSEQIEYITGGAAATWTIDFNTGAFNKPRTLRGTATMSFGYAASANDAVNVSGAIYHVRGAVETLISTEVGTAVAMNTAQKMAYLETPLTQTHIKQGDKVRLRVKIGQVAGGGAGLLGIDPKGRDGTVITAAAGSTTRFKLGLPFEVDL